MKRRPRAIPHLFRRWQQIADRIRARERVVVFLDFDGTLVAIAPRPSHVRVKPAIRRALEQLASDKSATVTVISGRRRAELKRYVAIPGLHHFGLYGWERNGNERIGPAARAALFRSQRLLAKHLAAYPGVWIEPKRNSFSVHLLGAKPAVQRNARSAVWRFLQPFGDTLQVFENLRDLEVLPLSVPDKGAATRESLSKSKSQDALVFFFGDDLSDEPAFAAVRHGVSVLVGRLRKTNAQFRLRNPGEVASALHKIKEVLDEHRSGAI